MERWKNAQLGTNNKQNNKEASELVWTRDEGGIEWNKNEAARRKAYNEEEKTVVNTKRNVYNK